MIDSYFRKPYQRVLVQPLTNRGLFARTHPLILTGIAALLGLLVPFFLINQQSFAAFCALILSGYLDTLDGTVARMYGKSSDLGAAFDIFSDRLTEFSVILGLFLIDPLTRGLPSLMMLGATLLCITSFLVVGIFSKNDSEKSFHYSPGIVERGEAFILFSLMILVPSQFFFLAYTFAAFVLLTSILRLYQFATRV